MRASAVILTLLGCVIFGAHASAQTAPVRLSRPTGAVLQEYGVNSHTGVDYAMTRGSVLYAPARSRVIEVVNGFSNVPNEADGWGNYVRLSHGCNVETIFAHMSNTPVPGVDLETCGDGAITPEEATVCPGDSPAWLYWQNPLTSNEIFECVDPTTRNPRMIGYSGQSGCNWCWRTCTEGSLSTCTGAAAQRQGCYGSSIRAADSTCCRPQMGGGGWERDCTDAELAATAHLHLEVHVNGRHVDPTPYLSGCLATHPEECVVEAPVTASATLPCTSMSGTRCVEWAETVPDGTRMTSEQRFSKEWTVRNDGTQAWENGTYALVYVPAPPDVPRSVTVDPMGGPARVDIPVGTTVEPGGTFTFSLQLTAPATSGTYRATYRMVRLTGAGEPFGELVWAEIEVPAVEGSCRSSTYGDRLFPPGTCIQDADSCNYFICRGGGQPMGNGNLRGDPSECTAFHDVPRGRCDGPMSTTPSTMGTPDAIYVDDLTVPDETPVLPGTVFRKVWRIQNTGTATWDESVRLVYDYDVQNYSLFAGGAMADPLEGDGARVDRVGPGSMATAEVTLRAPSTPGRYFASYRLQRNGVGFGQWFFTIIRVVPSPGTTCDVSCTPGRSVGIGTCVQNSGCGWERCTGTQVWEQATAADCSSGYAHPTCLSGAGAPTATYAFCEPTMCTYPEEGTCAGPFGATFCRGQTYCRPDPACDGALGPGGRVCVCGQSEESSRFCSECMPIRVEDPMYRGPTCITAAAG